MYSACLSASNATAYLTVNPSRFMAHFDTYTDPGKSTAVDIPQKIGRALQLQISHEKEERKSPQW